MPKKEKKQKKIKKVKKVKCDIKFEVPKESTFIFTDILEDDNI